MIRDGDLLWSASPERREGANLTRFMRQVEREWGVPLRDYASLHAFSVRDVDRFWKSVWTFAPILGDWDGITVRDPGATMAEDRWFPQARLNFAENMLRPRAAGIEAVVFRDETGVRRALGYAELLREVARVQAALEQLGVGQGDRVVGYLPNVPETLIAMLATTASGAIWAVVSPEISSQAAIERIGQLEPRILITSDGTRHGGREHDLLAKAAEVAAAMRSLVATVVVPNLSAHPAIGSLPGAMTWEQLLEGRTETEPVFARLPFAAPAFVMFTSGTTGKPKCLVHSGGGVLLQFAKEHLLHADLREGDRLFRFTSTGWMMWNWGVGALAWKVTVVLYEGSAFHPKTDALFDLAQAERLTYFSPSAAILDQYVKAGIRPAGTHDLSAMRTMYSGGMRVPAPHYGYVYQYIKQDLFFASPSGGTDPMAAFVAGDPTGSVRAGEIACPALGMKVELLDDEGRELQRGPGEFVCASPFPSIPLAFWGDPDRMRLLEAYFGRFPGKWSQGDWVERTPHGGFIMHGRSDATLKVRGIRIGTAEIYRPLEAVTEIEECAAVERQMHEGSEMVLFVRLKSGVVLDEPLRERIRQTLRIHASAHHVPARIADAPEFPRNSAGKVMELAVREAIHGREPRNVSAVVNPVSLDFFRRFSATFAAGDLA
ncbi:MAG: acetoacetate--CoA ligase [Lautropia sp.]